MTTAVFLDTTIQIARFIGPPEIKSRIEEQLCCTSFAVTSLVVRQEWKRRLLTDAKYVLGILRRKQLDVGATLRHIKGKLLASPHNKRKLSICLDILASGSDGQHTILDAGERLENLLVMLLEDGLSLFDDGIHIVRDSGCGCAAVDVMMNSHRQYEIGPTRCSTAPEQCGISEFFNSKKQYIRAIADHLKTVHDKDKSQELKNAEELIGDFLNGEVLPSDRSPCLNVGDLVIALESSGIPVFYTSNFRESMHLARALNQNLVVSSVDPDKSDIGHAF